MGWSPDVFFSSTILELSDAYVGRCKINGWGRWAHNGEASAEELRTQVGAMKEKFPDGPRRKLSKAEKRALRV